MAEGIWKTAWRIGRAILDSSLLTSEKTIYLPDKSSPYTLETHYDFGWDDLPPVSFKPDGTNPWTESSPGGNRLAWSASNGTTSRIMLLTYHVYHTVLQGQTDSYFHVHWEVANKAAGNIILIAYVSAALRDGAWSAETAVTITLTPSNQTNANQNNVTEVALPAAIMAYMEVDSLISIRLERNRGANLTDTYNSTVWVHTADIHTRFDNRPTTSKDKGSGWVKA